MADSKISRLSSSVSDLEAHDLGRPDTFRYNILTFVINEEYDRAIRTLKEFVDRDSDYPSFRLKIERYVLHAVDLIYAIRTKRNFPGLGGLTRTKQQELKDKFKEHYSELRMIMKRIENSMEELRLDDVKSTKIVVRSLWLSLVTIFIAGLFIDLIQGMGDTFTTVVDDKFMAVSNFVLEKFIN